ncbi:unnamed protein product, partial [Ectocarpus sp. 12 AP-2014]
QSILCSSAPREANHELHHASNSIDHADIPRREGNKPSHTGSSSSSHGNERAASGRTFAGVLRALLKPSSSPADAFSGSGDEGEEGEALPVGRSGVAGGWQPRTALDLSGHSFSKALKAEINRSKEKKMALKTSKTRSMNNLGSSSSNSSSNAAVKDSWWEKQESDESWFSRVSSTSTIPASPPELHQHQQRKPGPVCHARSFGDLDEMSLAVGLQ